jgi:hypothetical protein
MNAQNDLSGITGNHHEHSEDDHGDEDKCYQENKNSFDQIDSHLFISESPPKEKARGYEWYPQTSFKIFITNFA